MSHPAPDEVSPTPRRDSRGARRWGCLEFGLVGAAILLLAAVLLPPGIPAWPRRSAKQVWCQSNLKQLGMALKLYVDDYDTRLPPAHSWSDSLPAHVSIPGAFHCAEDRRPVSYAFHESLGRMRTARITNPGAQPLLYDSTLGVWNGTGQGESFARRHEHNHRNGWGNVAFADGHVKTLRAFPQADPGLQKAFP